MDDEALNAFELDRLDLMALETIVKCILNGVLLASDNPSAAARRLADLFENSVDLFELTGASGLKAAASKDYMRLRGLDIIAQAANPRQPDAPNGDGRG